MTSPARDPIARPIPGDILEWEGDQYRVTGLSTDREPQMVELDCGGSPMRWSIGGWQDRARCGWFAYVEKPDGASNA